MIAVRHTSTAGRLLALVVASPGLTLREQGLVEPGRGLPRIADDVPDPLTPEWWGRRLASLAEIDPDAEDYAPGGETAPCGTAVRIVARLREGATITDAVGRAGGAWEVYAALVQAEVVVPPGLAIATEAGRAVVEGWRVGAA